MITRENYEEFFLLYVDNELPPPARSAVERFVADNPDLKEEWEALLQCRVHPDQEPEFHDKDALLQYETSLLSYVDGELDEPEQKRVEEWMQAHPERLVALQQLLMTVSHPDPSVVFPDKDTLYRGRRRRVVLIPWMRAGIAAAVMGAVALLVLSRQHPQGPVAVVHKNIKTVVTPAAPAALYPAKNDEQATAMTTVKDTMAMVRDSRPRQKEKIERPAYAPPPVNGPQPVASVTKPAMDTATRSLRTAVAAVGPQPVGEQATVAGPVAVVSIPKEQSSFATQALLQQQQEDNSTDNSIADVSAAPAKNRLRGIFRKVSRAFGKTADRDDDGQRQVLISAFQVALK